MNVLAIGGTGFIGPYVARLLVEQGHRVAILHRGATTADPPTDVLHIHGDRDDFASLRPEVARFRPAIVLDLIAYTEPQASALMRAFRGLAERIVVLSSADVYRNYDGFRGKATAPPDPVPLSEAAPLREALHPYRGSALPFPWADDYEKLLVERAVMSDEELSGTVLRLPAVYGPGDKQHRIGAYLDRMRAEPRLPMTREQAAWRWTRGYVENVAAAIALAVVDDRATGRIYNVGEEPALAERAWVERIAEAADWNGQVVEAAPEDLPEQDRRPFDFRYELMIDTTRIRAELGYREPVGPDEALRRTIDWELARPRRSEALQ